MTESFENLVMLSYSTVCSILFILLALSLFAQRRMEKETLEADKFWDSVTPEHIKILAEEIRKQRSTRL